MDKLEREYGGKFKEIFKTITADNGSEFLSFRALEKSVFGGPSLKMYYAIHIQAMNAVQMKMQMALYVDSSLKVQILVEFP